MGSFRGDLASALDRVAELEHSNRELAQRAEKLEALLVAEHARPTDAKNTRTRSQKGDKPRWLLTGAAIMAMLVLGVMLMLALAKPALFRMSN